MVLNSLINNSGIVQLALNTIQFRHSAISTIHTTRTTHNTVCAVVLKTCITALLDSIIPVWLNYVCWKLSVPWTNSCDDFGIGPVNSFPPS